MTERRSIITQPLSAEETMEILSKIISETANSAISTKDLTPVEGDDLAVKLLSLTMLKKFIYLNTDQYNKFVQG